MDNILGPKASRLAWGGVLIAIFYLLATLGLAAGAAALALVPPAVASGVFVLVALLTAGKFHFVRREEEEEANLETFRREHPGTELFEESDEALRLARRAHQAYAKYVIPAVTMLCGAAALTACVLIWRHWTAVFSPGTAVADPLRYAVLAVGLFVAGLVGGTYYIGTSREPGMRWLRPCGAWLLFVSFLLLIAGVGLLALQWGMDMPRLDLIAGRVGLILAGILGAELIVNVIIEFYRPRTAQEQERPVYESRILALFTEPGGVARNIAVSLDYQFGFEVSEAWFYRFLERTLLPFAGVMVLAFWLMTCLEVIQPEENGIRERFGAVVEQEPLAPGLYFKLPWPFARIYTFPVQRVQEIAVGYTAGDESAEARHELDEAGVPVGDLSGRVIVWDKQHNKEEANFVVASGEKDANDRTGQQGEADKKAPVSAYFMAASIPLYYRVENLYDYAYRHRDPKATIARIGMREVVRYLASVDLFEVLTRERRRGGEELRRRVQEAADELNLGIEVVFLGLEGLHPPVRVGQSFNDVVVASEEMHTTILRAEKYAIGKEPEARGEAFAIRSDAEAYTYEKSILAEAEAQRFLKQLEAYNEAPDIFVLRSYLDVLEEETRDTRKFVISVTGGREVLVFDLAEKLRPDLLDVQLEPDETNSD